MDTTWSALIVDDDPGVRQSVRLCLEVDNARVLGVGTAAGALEAWKPDSMSSSSIYGSNRVRTERIAGDSAPPGRYRRGRHNCLRLLRDGGGGDAPGRRRLPAQTLYTGANPPCRASRSGGQCAALSDFGASGPARRNRGRRHFRNLQSSLCRISSDDVRGRRPRIRWCCCAARVAPANP